MPADQAARDTVLAALRDTGFLTYGNGFGAADTAVIVTGGALAEDAGHQGSTVARLAVGLAPHGSGTVLAGRYGSANGVSAVAVTRADAATAAAVSTVDDIDAESGRITTCAGPAGDDRRGAGRELRGRRGRDVGDRRSSARRRVSAVSAGSVLG